LIRAMPGTRNLILTTVQEADFDYVAPFIVSLKRTGYRGRVVFFASAMKGDAVSRLEQHGATVIPYRFFDKHIREAFFWPVWPLWRRFFGTKAFPKPKEMLAHVALPLFYRRHLICLQFLRAQRLQFDRIFLTDARDVYFQADPFSWQPGAGLHFFLLDANRTVGSSQLPANWTENQFGRRQVSHHLAKGVSCAGTTFGDPEGIINYLTQMVATSLGARKLRKISSDDQGVHNYLLHENLLPAVTLHPNRRSAVLTTGAAMTMADIQIGPDGTVINEAGQAFPVLHQYDRIPALKQHLMSRLAAAG
jgi:hypothetical protein